MDRRGRTARLDAIRRLVAERRVASQEELAGLLEERGMRASQSTLSRDIRALGLVKRPVAGGRSYYALPAAAGDRAGALERLLPDLLTAIEGAGHLLVLKTLTGAAQPVAAALDHARWPEVVGTVAGDDTLLVVLRSAGQRERVRERIRELAGRG